MKIEEIRALSSENLTKQLDAAYKELFDLRSRHATKQLVNYHEMGRVKKEIARLKTIANEKKLSVVSSPADAAKPKAK